MGFDGVVAVQDHISRHLDEGKGEIAWVAKGLSGMKFAAIAAKLRKEMDAWLQKKMIGPELLTPVLTNGTAKRFY